MQRHFILKIIGNFSDCLSYAVGALIKVDDLAGLTVAIISIHTVACIALTRHK